MKGCCHLSRSYRNTFELKNTFIDTNLPNLIDLFEYFSDESREDDQLLKR